MAGLLRGLANIAQENTTANVLVEDQLRPPLKMVPVDQERELHKQTADLGARPSLGYESSN